MCKKGFLVTKKELIKLKRQDNIIIMTKIRLELIRYLPNPFKRRENYQFVCTPVIYTGYAMCNIPFKLMDMSRALLTQNVFAKNDHRM